MSLNTSYNGYNYEQYNNINNNDNSINGDKATSEIAAMGMAR